MLKACAFGSRSTSYQGGSILPDRKGIPIAVTREDPGFFWADPIRFIDYFK